MAAASQHLVLIGGGHAHALLLAQWAKRPVPGVKVTLIDTNETAPYTGMLPGYIAGHYEAAELMIDLRALAKKAGATFVASKVVAFQAATQSLACTDGTKLQYDIASFDIGIHSQLTMIPGQAEHTVAAKPLHTYATQWQKFITALKKQETIAPITVVGGGVAGVELAFAMRYRAAREGISSVPVQIIEANKALLGVSPRAQVMLRCELARQNITIYEDSLVSTFTTDGIELADGRTLPSSFTVTAAGAHPYAWLMETDLSLQAGYITVDATLQTTEYQNVFAVGDCAHFVPLPLPKAGVYAVRQAPVLYKNVCALVESELLQSFHPQSSYLKLISLGDKRALADKYRWPIVGRLVWYVKNYIDRSFMRRFNSNSL